MLVIIIQCDDVTKRCSGFFCTQDFYERNGAFKDYPDGTQYMTMTCGGCCATLLNAKLANLKLRMSKGGFSKEDIIFHLASCICSDNAHHEPCPFINRIRKIILRKGFTEEQIKSGSHISKTAQARRNSGEYKAWK